MNILLHADPGPVAVSLVKTVFEEVGTVDNVIFDTNKLRIGKTGRFIPETRTVILDLDHILKDQRWTRLGMFRRHAVWCNLLMTIYHEVAHAWQFKDAGWVTLPPGTDIEALDREADGAALEDTSDWLIANHTPNLDMMGWLGEMVTQQLNLLFASGNLYAEKEVDLLGTSIAASAEVVTANYGGFTVTDVECLLNRIDEGDIGCIRYGARWLAANEVVGLEMEEL